MITPLVAMPGGWELIVIVLVIVLLFGARKLPELARGTGQALRIFKAETKGLVDEDEESKPEQLPPSSAQAQESQESAPESKPSQSDGT